MPIKILALETATPACSAALWSAGECAETLRLEQNRHAETLLPMAEELLAHAGAAWNRIDALALGIGPGSFTGLRIGIAMVQGLALGAGLPVVPVSSLLAIATRVGAARVLAAIDARMNQVYWNLYRRRGLAMVPLHEARVNRPGDVLLADAALWVAAGSGCDAYPDELARGTSAQVEALRGVHPHAADIARIAALEFQAGRAIDARDLAPAYVRDNVVHRDTPAS